MREIKWPFFVVLLVLVVVPLILHAYAEVNSFQTDKSFYIPGNKIYFTGTVEITDYQKPVTLVIHDPTGKFVLISSNYSNSIYTFEMTVNTNDTSQFYTKGIYSATAFVENPSTGKTITFDFSPDGSPVTHQVPSTANTTGTTNSGQPNSQHYKSQLNENVATNDITGNPQKVQTTISGSSEKTSAPSISPNILYPVISLCGVGIVVALFYVKKRNLKSDVKKHDHQQFVPTVIQDEQKDDYAMVILKNRLAKGEITLGEFNSIKNVLSEP